MLLREMQIHDGMFQLGVPQQDLNRAQVRAGFQQVSGKAVPEGLLILLMIRIQQRSAIASIRSMA
jgi:hypothetical protein